MSGGGGGGIPMAGTGGGSRVPQPGYEQMTDYSMGFGRIAQQPSFFNPFSGYYGQNQPFGGFGGFGGGFGSPFGGMYGGGYDPFGGFGGGGFDRFGGGFGGGIGGLFGGYNPSPFGGYSPFERGNAYVQPLPQPMPRFDRPSRPPRDPDMFYALPMPVPNPNPPGLQGGGLNDPMEIVYDSLGQPGYRTRALTPEEVEAGRAAVRSGSPIAF